MQSLKAAIIFVAVLFVPTLACPETILVPDDHPTIQGAIDAAVNGDTVLVKPGTYMESIDFKGKAIMVKGEMGAADTVIDGNQAGTVVTCKSGEALDSVLEGFTISNGSADNGGGMYNLDSNPTVANCAFSGNLASLHGGGMYNWNSSPRIVRCIFSSNTADEHEGGGMYNRSSSPILTGCTFKENGAYGAGGMYSWNSSLMMTDCNFINNWARYDGGGMMNSHSIPTVANCIFYGNRASLNNGRGGGMWNVNSDSTVTNCTFFDNSAGVKGGGMVNWESNPKVTNCILWGDKPDEIFIHNSSTYFITYSCIQGGWAGSGNIDTDPLFVDLVIGDCHLTCISPCKDTGDNAAAGLPIEDFENDPRVAYGTVDMGADEFYTHLYVTGDATPGGEVEAKFVGLPGTTPVGLWLGLGALDPPLQSMFGSWYLAPPWIGPIVLGSIPSPEGVLILPATVHRYPPPPYDLFMQALIGLNPDSLTNLCVLEVR